MRHPSRAMPTVGLALMFVLGAASAAAADTPSPAPGPAAASPSTAPGGGHDTKHGTDHQTKPGTEPMPGMDMPATKPAAGTGTGHDSMPGMDMPAPADEHPAPVSRPRGLVLGGFAAINGAVLLGAVGLRRRSAAK